MVPNPLRAKPFTLLLVALLCIAIIAAVYATESDQSFDLELFQHRSKEERARTLKQFEERMNNKSQEETPVLLVSDVAPVNRVRGSEFATLAGAGTDYEMVWASDGMMPTDTSVGAQIELTFGLQDKQTNDLLESFTDQTLPIIDFYVYDTADPNFTILSASISCSLDNTADNAGYTQVGVSSAATMIGCTDYSTTLLYGGCLYQNKGTFYALIQPGLASPSVADPTSTKVLAWMIRNSDYSADWASGDYHIAATTGRPTSVFRYHDDGVSTWTTWSSYSTALTPVNLGGSLRISILGIDMGGNTLSNDDAANMVQHFGAILGHRAGTDRASFGVVDGTTWTTFDTSTSIGSFKYQSFPHPLKASCSYYQGDFYITFYQPTTASTGATSLIAGEWSYYATSSWPNFDGYHSISVSTLSASATTTITASQGSKASIFIFSFTASDKFGNVITTANIQPSAIAKSNTDCPIPTCGSSCCTNGVCTYQADFSSYENPCTYTITGYKQLIGKWGAAVLSTGDSTVTLNEQYSTNIISNSLPINSVSSAPTQTQHQLVFQILDSTGQAQTTFTSFSKPIILFTVETLDSNGVTIGDDELLTVALVCSTPSSPNSSIVALAQGSVVVGCNDYLDTLASDSTCSFDATSKSFTATIKFALASPRYTLNGGATQTIAAFTANGMLNQLWDLFVFDVKPGVPLVQTTLSDLTTLVPDGKSLPVGTNIVLSVMSVDSSSNYYAASELSWFNNLAPLLGYPVGTDTASIGATLVTPAINGATGQPAASAASWTLTETSSFNGAPAGCTFRHLALSVTFYTPMTIPFVSSAITSTANPNAYATWLPATGSFAGAQNLIITPLTAVATTPIQQSSSANTATPVITTVTYTFTTTDKYGNPTAVVVPKTKIATTGTACPAPSAASDTNICAGSSCTFTVQYSQDTTYACTYTVTGFKTVTGKYKAAVLSDNDTKIALTYTPSVEYGCTWTSADFTTPSAKVTCDAAGLNTVYCNSGPKQSCRAIADRQCYVAGTTVLAKDQTLCNSSPATTYLDNDTAPITQTCPSTIGSLRDINCTRDPFDYQCTYQYGTNSPVTGSCSASSLSALICNEEYSTCSVSVSSKCVDSDDVVQDTDELCKSSGAVNGFAGASTAVPGTCASNTSASRLSCFPSPSAVQSTFVVPTTLTAAPSQVFTLPIKDSTGAAIYKTTANIVFMLVESANFTAKDCTGDNICFNGVASTSGALTYTITATGAIPYTAGKKVKLVCTIDGVPCTGVNGAEVAIVASIPASFTIDYYEYNTTNKLSLATVPYVAAGTKYTSYCKYADQCLMYGYTYTAAITLFDQYHNQALPVDSNSQLINMSTATEFTINYSSRLALTKKCAVSPTNELVRYDVAPNASKYPLNTKPGCYWDATTQQIKIDYAVPDLSGAGADPSPLNLTPTTVVDVVSMSLWPGSVTTAYFNSGDTSTAVRNSYSDNKIMTLAAGDDLLILFDPDWKKLMSGYKTTWLPPAVSSTDARVFPYEVMEFQIRWPDCPESPNVGASLANDFQIFQSGSAWYAQYSVTGKIKGSLQLYLDLVLDGEIFFTQILAVSALSPSLATTPVVDTTVQRVESGSDVTYPHTTVVTFQTTDEYGNEAIGSVQPSTITVTPTGSGTCPTVICPNNECCDIDSSVQYTMDTAATCPTVVPKTCSFTLNYAVVSTALSCQYNLPFQPSHGFNKPTPTTPEEAVSYTLTLPTTAPPIYQYRCTIQALQEDGSVVDSNSSSVYTVCSDLALQNVYCSSVNQQCSLKTVSRVCFDITSNSVVADISLCEGGNADKSHTQNPTYNNLVIGETFKETIGVCPTAPYSYYDLKCPLAQIETPPIEEPETDSSSQFSIFVAIITAFVAMILM